MTKIEITKLRPYEKGFLKGFVDILIQPLGLAVHNLTWFKKEDGREWVNLPSEKYTNSEGEEKYRPYVSFPDEQVYKGFQSAMVKAIGDHLAGSESAPLPPAPPPPPAPQQVYHDPLPLTGACPF